MNNDEMFSYKIFSVRGELLKKGKFLHDISVDFLKKGVYFIEIRSKSFQKIKKFIVK